MKIEDIKFESFNKNELEKIIHICSERLKDLNPNKHVTSKKSVIFRETETVRMRIEGNTYSKISKVVGVGTARVGQYYRKLMRVFRNRSEYGHLRKENGYPFNLSADQLNSLTNDEKEKFKEAIRIYKENHKQ